jgi:glycosyltransferase involved in cell wall biosynthesis
MAEPGAFPPTVNTSILLADAGWHVNILSAPTRALSIRIPTHDGIAVHTVRERETHVVDKITYAKYFGKALALARTIRPQFVFAFDRLSAGPGVAASIVSGADLIYHEHDSPEPNDTSWVARIRAICARSAKMVVFPNEDRARIATASIGLRPERVHVAWNVPRLSELPNLVRDLSDPSPLILYYHGNVSPVLLPEAVLKAVQRFEGRVVLRIVGYESPSAPGYLSHLQRIGRDTRGFSLVRYEGQTCRRTLLQNAVAAHVGLAFAPTNPSNLNERFLLGASNKIFDYMAAGLAVLVAKDTPFGEFFVSRRLARACDPSSSGSVASALSWFLGNTEARLRMDARARLMIENEWNYDVAFAELMKSLVNEHN